MCLSMFKHILSGSPMSTKSELLKMLEQNKGTFLRGEELGEKMQVSRTAIWKAVKSLREEGYHIRAVKNRGYVLEEENDILSEQAVRLWLKDQDAEVEIWKEIPSTNQRLKQAAMERRLPAGSMVAAESQNAGRGRRGRSFYSPKESGIYLSVLLYPKKTAGESLEITAAAAVAVCRAVEKVCGVSLGIKWVNDLYRGGKKVCGILTEAVTDFETGDIEFAVVGIGLNLWNPPQGFPGQLKDSAGAVFEKKVPADRNRLVGEIVNELLLECDKPGVPAEYRTRNIVPGRTIQVAYGNKERQVKALEILRDGRLLVENEKGQEEILPCGDVSVFFEEQEENCGRKSVPEESR